MRTFILRARKGTVSAEKVFSQVGSGEHIEIIAHTLANAFYFSNGMRSDVEVYVVLDSTPDYPRTLKFSSNDKLSFPGFHESAILDVITSALERGSRVSKDEKLAIEPGIDIFGFGFEKLIKTLMTTSPVYMLDKKGDDIREVDLEQQSVFVLTDHLPLPKNNMKSLERQGVKKISLGRKMLFASQCVVLIHNELDRRC